MDAYSAQRLGSGVDERSGAVGGDLLTIGRVLLRHKVLIAATMTDTDDPDYSFEIIYLDNPQNRSWRKGGDALPWRRAVVAATMVSRFGEWREGSK